MRKRFRFLAILAIGAMLLFPACTATGSDTPATGVVAPATTIPQLASQVQSLNSQVAALSNQVANLPAAGATDTTALQQQISTLSTVISELSARVVSLENELATGGSTGSTTITTGEIDETTRWDIDAWVDYTGGYGLVDMDWETRTRIEDEDDYTVYLYLENLNINEYSTIPEASLLDAVPDVGDLWWNGDDMYKCVTDDTWDEKEEADMDEIYNPVYIDGLTVTFRPKSGDRVVVNADDTFLDSYSRPYLDWDAEVSVRSDGTCRNIKCVTDTQFELPIPTSFGSSPEEPSLAQLKLVFELYYG